jgi:hypothetical protein
MIEEKKLDDSESYRATENNSIRLVQNILQDNWEENYSEEDTISLIESGHNGTGDYPNHDIFTPSGIDAYDAKFGGLVLNSLNLFKTNNYEAGIATIGAFISQGLNNGERVALVGFSNPKHIFYKLARYGYTNLEKHLDNEQLVYLYYKPFFEKQLSLSIDYGEMLDELVEISGPGITRLALDNCEVMFNNQSQKLAKTSAIKLLLATERRSFTTLGTFSNENIGTDYDLGQVCESTMASYITVEQDSENNSNLFHFTAKKSPDVYKKNTLRLELTTGIGFIQ